MFTYSVKRWVLEEYAIESETRLTRAQVLDITQDVHTVSILKETVTGPVVRAKR